MQGILGRQKLILADLDMVEIMSQHATMVAEEVEDTMVEVAEQ